jgi:four helix bundle protein
MCKFGVIRDLRATPILIKYYLMSYSDNLIVNLTYQFSLQIVTYCESLEALRKYNLANQLFRSGTSIGANIREAQGAESKADFKHKMRVAYKEAEETEYWLNLCKDSKTYPDPPNELFIHLQNIIRITGKIISTTSKFT